MRASCHTIRHCTDQQIIINNDNNFIDNRHVRFCILHDSREPDHGNLTTLFRNILLYIIGTYYNINDMHTTRLDIHLRVHIYILFSSATYLRVIIII